MQANNLTMSTYRICLKIQKKNNETKMKGTTNYKCNLKKFIYV